MNPVTVAGHVMIGELHNDLHMTGPHGGPDGPVQLYLRNGYGVSLGTSWYENDTMPMVAPIRKDGSAIGWDYAWSAHPDFKDTQCGERGGDVDRAREILAHLKGLES